MGLLRGHRLSREGLSRLLVGGARLGIYVSLLTPLIYFQDLYYPSITGKSIFFRATVEGALFLFILAYMAKPHGEEFSLNLDWRGKIFVGLVAAFALLYFSSAFWGPDVALGLFSNFERGQGGVQMLHYLAFFLLLVFLFRTPQHWQRLLGVSLAVATGVCLYGLGQWWEHRCVIGAAGDMAELQKCRVGTFAGAGSQISGTLGNPFFLAAYLNFQLFFAVSLMITNRRPLFRCLLMALAGFFTVSLFMTQIRAALLGWLAALLVAAAGFAFMVLKDGGDRERKRNKFLYGAVTLGTVLLLTVVAAYVGETRYTALFKVSTILKALEDRLVVWSMSMAALRDWPWGWGPENLPLVLDPYYDPRLGGVKALFYDRVHNVFLDYAVVGGVPLVVVFLAIWVVFFVLLIRNTQRGGAKAHPTAQAVSFAAAGVFYLVQGQTSFDVTTTYQAMGLFWGFFLITGGAIGQGEVVRELKKGRGTRKETLPAAAATGRIWWRWILLLLVPVIVYVFYTLSWLPWQRARLLFDAVKKTERTYDVVIRIPDANWGLFFREMEGRFHPVLYHPSPIGGEETFIAYVKLLKDLLRDARMLDIPIPAGEVHRAANRCGAEAAKLEAKGVLRRSESFLEGAYLFYTAGVMTHDRDLLGRALQCADRVLQRAPRMTAARIVSLDAAIAAGDRDRAERELTWLVSLRPDLKEEIRERRAAYGRRFGGIAPATAP